MRGKIEEVKTHGKLNGEIRHFTSEKVKSILELQFQNTNKKGSFQINGELVKNMKIIKSKPINRSERMIETKGRGIQKALSCDFKKTVSESKKKEIAKKSESGIVRRSPLKDREKKNKSWDHFRATSSEMSSKTSLVQRVSDALERRKPASEWRVSAKTKEKVNDKDFLKNQKRQCHCSSESSKKINNTEELPEKSLSFQNVQFPNFVVSNLCKSISLETRLPTKTDKRSVIFDQYKNSLVTKMDTVQNLERGRSPLSHSSETSNQCPHFKGLCNGTDNLILKGHQLGTKPAYKHHKKPQFSQIDKFSNQLSVVLKSKLLGSDKGSSQDCGLFKKYNNEAPEHLRTISKNIKICQCPHFHTEEGIKKLCLQNSSDEQEYGRKFFRVNYILKEDGKGEREYVDTGTTMEDEPVKKKPKIIKNEKEKKTVWTKTKDTKIITKKNQQNCKTEKTYPSRKIIVGETPKNSIKLQRTFTKKPIKEKKDRNLNEAAVTEVETLRKLFDKLKSVEISLKKETRPEKSKSVSRNSLKEKANETSETETKDELKEDSKRLKAKIVQHVQNWLNAEFKDS